MYAGSNYLSCDRSLTITSTLYYFAYANFYFYSSTKVRPGLMSPAVTGVAAPAFSFPVAVGNKTPPTRAKAAQVARPKPPAAVQVGAQLTWGVSEAKQGCY